jgi:2-hydroxyglutarate dehydrogenase
MYPLGSLKSLLCLRGREKLYTRCSKKGIPFRQVGKLILASTSVQEEHIKGLVERGKEIKRRGEGEVPLVWMTGEEIREIEPDVGEAVKSGLFSERTGIVDSHVHSPRYIEYAAKRSRTYISSVPGSHGGSGEGH